MKPKSCTFPKELKTLGDHIRKRRLDLGLLQVATGQRIGVHCTTVWNWEHGYVEPELLHLPKIIAFLGYDPRPEPERLSARLVWYRQGRGWSQKRFAEILGVDQSTLARWERGEREPMGEHATLVEVSVVGVECADYGRTSRVLKKAPIP